MRAVICGVGRMGTAISWAMDQLGYHVVGIDTNPKAANKCGLRNLEILCQ